MNEAGCTLDGEGDNAIRDGELRGWRREMTYGGVQSFLRRRYTRDLRGAEVVVSGIPYDGATTYRPGTRLGPAAIRAASAQLAELPAYPQGFDPGRELAVIDAGDCFIDPHRPETVAESIEAHASAILGAGATMLSLGGDHFVSYPLLRAHAERHGPVALLQFDAHCDTWPDRPGSLDHGTMFARAAAEGVIDVQRSTQLGLRTHNDSDGGFEILGAPWVHRNGVEAALAVIAERAGEAPLYLSFDIDCLDPAFAPGTGTPVCGGLASWQALALIGGLHRFNLIGMDVVEVSPPYDHADITALAAASVAHAWLCQLALRRGAVARPLGRV